MIRRWSIIEVAGGPDRLAEAERELIRHYRRVHNHETRDRGIPSWGRGAAKASA